MYSEIGLSIAVRRHRYIYRSFVYPKTNLHVSSHAIIVKVLQLHQSVDPEEDYSATTAAVLLSSSCPVLFGCLWDKKGYIL